MIGVPIPMRLVCESCGRLHVDEGEFATKPHHTHACQYCGAVWRPAIECTVGVRFLPGFKNGDSSVEIVRLREQLQLASDRRDAEECVRLEALLEARKADIT